MGPSGHNRVFFLLALSLNMYLTGAGLLSVLKLSQSSSGWKRRRRRTKKISHYHHAFPLSLIFYCTQKRSSLVTTVLCNRR